MARGTVRLATRGSDLALWQARSVAERLRERRYEVELVEVRTRGDELRDELIHRLGRTGAFVRALDREVLDEEVDAAVHSMKDMPTESPEELVVAAVPERGPAGDVLLTPDGDADGVGDLPEGATVGTASVRRRAQLLDRRPDLTVEPVRGNVDTRVEKLLAPSLQREHERRLAAEGALDADDGSGGDAEDGSGSDADVDDGDGDRGDRGTDAGEGDGDDADDDGSDGPDDGDREYERSAAEWFRDLPEIHRGALERRVETEYDALVLAAAGLSRLGLDRSVSPTPLRPESFVPAPGQGALAVTAREGEFARRLHDTLDHPRSRVETTVERTVLAELGGGCVAPVGAHAVLRGECVHAVVAVHGPDGRESVTATRDLPVERHARAAREFAADVADRGGADLVARAAGRADDPDPEGTGGEESPDGAPADGDGPDGRAGGTGQGGDRP